VRAEARSGAVEFVDPPRGGRTFSITARPLLGDCAPSGRLRLDALARMLQDVAYLDVDDAGVAELAIWVVRRARIDVRRFPRFGEELTLTTFCSGLGKMWAERRTRVELSGVVGRAAVDVGMAGVSGTAAGDHGAVLVEAVSLWVHLDPASWLPSAFTDRELELYGDAAAGRRVTARLRHRLPGAEASSEFGWQFHELDCDIARHVNNAAYLQPLEEELLLAGADPSALEIEVEYRSPAQPGEMTVLRDGEMRWIRSVTGDTHASLRVGRTV
jgi:acyl-ACP thioesterase